MIHIKGLSLSFSSQSIFNDISLHINNDARIGLVGRNGSGKSTLLKVIAGQQQTDSGSISVLPGKKIAYMPQEVVLLSDKTILEETMEANADITSLQKRLAVLQEKIDDGETDGDIIDEYVNLHERIALLEPAQLQAQAERILLGLGFKQNQFNQPVDHLSVGWKMRVVLAKLLLQKADFYLFDEPTNHLDIVAKDWFITFLQSSNFGFLLVCHERYFLDKLCTNIIALEQAKAKVYKGNYSTFEVQYAHDMEQLQAAYTQQQKEIKQKAETIERYKAKASKAKMAKSMQKKLDNLERITLPTSTKQIHFNFSEVKRSSRIVLELQNISHQFNDKTLFKQVNLKIERNERVALVAANGVGKTTLFNLIVGNLPLQQGKVIFGENVQYAIFAQDQNQALKLNETVFQNVQEHCSKKSEQQIRSFLGAFLFGNEEIKKQVKVLSGGEKNRVAMAIVLMQDSNFLLLDEPTNHLDMASKETLIEALRQFQGTILFVSHDHTFINELATRVVELTPQGALGYDGNYDDYLHQKKETVVHQQTNKPQEDHSKKTPEPEHHANKKQIQSIEQKIERCETEIEKINNVFEHISYGTVEFEQNERKLFKKKQELEQLIKEWEALS